jgi:hypothetical protein
MTITLADSHRRWLEELAAREGSTIDRMLADLIEDAWESEEAEAKVAAAIAGPPAEPMTATDWDHLRGRVTNRPRASAI